MKILIAYDGSECSDAAIVDLRRAGLPAVAEVSILTVVETPVGAAAATYGVVMAGSGCYVPDAMESDLPPTHRVAQAEAFAALVADRLHADFPDWHICIECWVDSAGAAIIRKAHAWKPDLIVLGSHGRSGFSGLVLGSVSQHVLHHVSESVRISRHRLHPQKRSIRLLVGVDGSTNAQKAVRAVEMRNWPIGTEVRVVGVLDSAIALAAAMTPSGAVPVEIEEESQHRMSKAVREAAHGIAKYGLSVTHQLFAGNPDDVLLAEAERWGADCVFVGARGLNGLQRFLLGSVSTAVASKARCSVEVVQ